MYQDIRGESESLGKSLGMFFAYWLFDKYPLPAYQGEG